jgi:acetyl esterase
MSYEPHIPNTLWSLLDSVGPNWHTDVQGNISLVINEFSKILKYSPKDGVIRKNNVFYGHHDRQVLDFFMPKDAYKPPVVLFLHGGAFIDGCKDRSEEIYSNVMYFLARRGVCAINVEYRLAPEYQYPSGIQDVALAVNWAIENSLSIGFDPKKMFLFGHSSGAAHVAGFAYGSDYSDIVASVLKGLIIVSGRVRADNLPENPNARKVEAYFGNSPGRLDQLSPVNLVSDKSVATFIAIAEFENPLIDVYCSELFYRLSVLKRKSPVFFRAPRHNHTSIIAQFNLAENYLGNQILNFIRTRAP